jgi:hypothetical protein
MRAFRRPRSTPRALGVLVLHTSMTLACSGGSPLAPSPLIIPDAVTVPVGQMQIFNVQNATVERFDLAADRQRWSSCVAIDETFNQANSIRLIALSQCVGRVYIIANIGSNRSPLGAVMQVE